MDYWGELNYIRDPRNERPPISSENSVPTITSPDSGASSPLSPAAGSPSLAASPYSPGTSALNAPSTLIKRSYSPETPFRTPLPPISASSMQPPRGFGERLDNQVIPAQATPTFGSDTFSRFSYLSRLNIGLYRDELSEFQSRVENLPGSSLNDEDRQKLRKLLAEYRKILLFAFIIA